jgi:hypothetical protein
VIFQISGTAEVVIEFEDECGECGRYYFREMTEKIEVNAEVDVPNADMVLDGYLQGVPLKNQAVVYVKGEKIYFRKWIGEPTVKPLPVDVLMRRRGEAELWESKT